MTGLCYDLFSNLGIWKIGNYKRGERKEKILEMKNFNFQFEIHMIFHMAWYSKPYIPL